ncbi:Uncharacterized protein HZ326_3570 [Fusarium oxysporum f. sp. albedinis]|nr:Uncharacterized protein HZ326_3570 [Fusarium oxysporum f. sp. albedinis]
MSASWSLYQQKNLPSPELGGVMARRHPRGFHLGSSTGDTIHTVLAPCPDSRRDGVDTEHYSMMKAGGLP